MSTLPRKAGNALAVGLYSASVFHAMRAAEIGVRVFATNLEVTFNHPLDQEQWGTILKQCNAKILTIQQLPKGKSKAEDLEFYSLAAAQFHYFKDGYRIRNTHGKADFDETQAASVLKHTTDFFEEISKRLKENL